MTVAGTPTYMAPEIQVTCVWFGCTLPETNIATENGWLEYDPFLLGWPISRDYVSFREGRFFLRQWDGLVYGVHHKHLVT